MAAVLPHDSVYYGCAYIDRAQVQPGCTHVHTMFAHRDSAEVIRKLRRKFGEPATPALPHRPASAVGSHGRTLVVIVTDFS